MMDDNLAKGRQLSRRNVLRDALTLVIAMILVEISSMLYSIYALGLYREGRWVPLALGTAVATGPVVVIMVIFCLRWARGVIVFHRVLFSQAEPTLAQTQEGLRSIFRFARNGALLFILVYTLAINSVSAVLYWKYHFSITELFELGVFKFMSGLNLGVMLYYAVKIVESRTLGDVAERLLASGLEHFDHFKLRIRYKIFLVIFTVVAYLLSGAILMGLNQVENVQRIRLQEDLEFWAGQLPARLSQSRPTPPEAGEAGRVPFPELETQLSPRAELLILSGDGEILQGNADRLSPDQIRAISQSQTPGILTDYQKRTLVLYRPLPGQRLTAVWMGHWGTAAGMVETRNVILALLVATLFLSLVATFLLVNDINQPLQRVLEFLRTLSSGEKAGRLRAYSEDELGDFAVELARTTALLEQKTAKAAELLTQVRAISTAIEENSLQVKASVGAQAHQIIEQAGALTQAQTTSEEITAASRQIAQAVANVHSAAERNLQACTSGTEQMADALGSFRALNRYVEEISRQILALAETVQQITGVVRLIEEIADQINLLSLNAQLEAAGSGAGGRRFAVVAEEVSRLAANSMKAVEQIKSLVEATVSSARKVSDSAGQGSALVGQGAAAADSVGKIFAEIVGHADTTEKAAVEISTIATEQNTATDQMAQTIADIHANSQMIKDNANQVLAAMDRLANAADRLALAFSKSPTQFPPS